MKIRREKTIAAPLARRVERLATQAYMPTRTNIVAARWGAAAFIALAIISAQTSTARADPPAGCAHGACVPPHIADGRPSNHALGRIAAEWRQERSCREAVCPQVMTYCEPGSRLVHQYPNCCGACVPEQLLADPIDPPLAQLPCDPASYPADDPSTTLHSCTAASASDSEAISFDNPVFERCAKDSAGLSESDVLTVKHFDQLALFHCDTPVRAEDLAMLQDGTLVLIDHEVLDHPIEGVMTDGFLIPGITKGDRFFFGLTIDDVFVPAVVLPTAILLPSDVRNVKESDNDEFGDGNRGSGLVEGATATEGGASAGSSTASGADTGDDLLVSALASQNPLDAGARVEDDAFFAGLAASQAHAEFWLPLGSRYGGVSDHVKNLFEFRERITRLKDFWRGLDRYNTWSKTFTKWMWGDLVAGKPTLFGDAFRRAFGIRATVIRDGGEAFFVVKYAIRRWIEPEPLGNPDWAMGNHWVVRSQFASARLFTADALVFFYYNEVKNVIGGAGEGPDFFGLFSLLGKIGSTIAPGAFFHDANDSLSIMHHALFDPDDADPFVETGVHETKGKDETGVRNRISATNRDPDVYLPVGDWTHNSSPAEREEEANTSTSDASTSPKQTTSGSGEHVATEKEINDALGYELFPQDTEENECTGADCPGTANSTGNGAGITSPDAPECTGPQCGRMRGDGSQSITSPDAPECTGPQCGLMRGDGSQSITSPDAPECTGLQCGLMRGDGSRGLMSPDAPECTGPGCVVMRGAAGLERGLERSTDLHAP